MRLLLTSQISASYPSSGGYVVKKYRARSMPGEQRLPVMNKLASLVSEKAAVRKMDRRVSFHVHVQIARRVRRNIQRPWRSARFELGRVVKLKRKTVLARLAICVRVKLCIFFVDRDVCVSAPDGVSCYCCHHRLDGGVEHTGHGL